MVVVAALLMLTMYTSFFGLREPPFELTANPRFLYFTAGHREALSNLEYGLSTAKPVTLLLGDAGTGKTTLLRAALESERCRDVQCVVLNNPALRRDEFLETLAREFELSALAATSKAALLTELDATLKRRRSSGRISALLVDEAQSLSQDLLEEIRLLANIETADEKLLPLVLAGQPEFSARLNEPGLRQLKQRVALRCEVSAFNLQETAAYIAMRIKTAGGDAARLFTRDAVVMVYERSKGIARTINVICDNALLSAFAIGRQLVDREIVSDVCKDFDLERSSTARPRDGAVSEVEPPGRPAKLELGFPPDSDGTAVPDDEQRRSITDPTLKRRISG
jgi:general secretion pathway protein A